MKNNNELPIYLFHQGTNYNSYKLLGSHPLKDTSGTVFRVWAPEAKSVHVVGNFNSWEKNSSFEMERIDESGIWEKHIAFINSGELYKYLITTNKNKEIYKSDPFAFSSQTQLETASIIYDINNYVWNDANWQFIVIFHSYSIIKYLY